MAERASDSPQEGHALGRETPATESRNLTRKSTAAEMSIYRFVPGEGDPALVVGGGLADLAAVAEPGHAAHREAGDAAGELGRGADVRAEVARADRRAHRGCNRGVVQVRSDSGV